MDRPTWNELYQSGEALPWDTGEPDRHLVAFWKSEKQRARRLLEVGCGTGTNCVWLARQGSEVLGLDVSAAAVERARERQAHSGVTARFKAADFLRDDLDEPPFDLVFDRGCFHVFDAAEDRIAFVRNVARLLGPSGRWLSLIGSTEGAPREVGPPRRSAREVVDAIEPALRIVELRAVEFDARSPEAPAAWLCLSARRDIAAQPSTDFGGRE